MTTPKKIVVKKTTKKVNVTESAPNEVSITSKGGRGPKGETGGTGEQGAQGAPGIQGPPGTVENISYTHVQNTPASEWDILHNLGFKPNVTTYDSGGTEVVGDIVQHDNNSMTIIFSSSFSGEANLS